LTPREGEGLFRYAPQAFPFAQLPGKARQSKEKPAQNIHISDNPTVRKQPLPDIFYNFHPPNTTA
jgi:hypothetical protein